MPRVTSATPEGVALLLPYANTILGAIQGGANVAQLWDAVKASEAEGGPLIAGATIFDMNYVTAQMRAIANAQDALTQAEPYAQVTSQMWAWAPWADTSAAAWSEPSYIMRYSYDVELPSGNTVTLWGQTTWEGSIEGPVSRISDRAFASAQANVIQPSPNAADAFGGEEGGQVSGIGAIQLMRV